MNATLHPPHSTLDNLRIILVGTLYGGNIGSACRAMANTGISHLRLAAPDPDIDWAEARKMACHAEPILDARETFPDLASAVADCVAVVGTTARRGLYRQHALTPREHAPDLLRLARTGPVALVFGREDKGLLNDEIAQCTRLVQIPTATDYASLNLSQAVLLLCHELFLTACTGEACLAPAAPHSAHRTPNSALYEPVAEKSPPAPAALRERMFDMWQGYLLDIGFMEPPKADHMMAAFRRIFSRGVLTQADATILMGVIRQSRWAIDHKEPEKQPPGQ